MMMRIQGLFDMVRSEKAEQWHVVDKETGNVSIHTAVLEAAASQPLKLRNDMASFTEDSFFAAVETAAECMLMEAQPGAALTQ